MVGVGHGLEDIGVAICAAVQPVALGGLLVQRVDRLLGVLRGQTAHPVRDERSAARVLVETEQREWHNVAQTKIIGQNESQKLKTMRERLVQQRRHLVPVRHFLDAGGELAARATVVARL